jgi:hypothetical protein
MTAPSGITRKKRWRCRRQALGKDGAALCNNRLEKKDGAAGAADKNHIHKEGAVFLHEQRWRWLSHKKILRKDGAGIDFTKNNAMT